MKKLNKENWETKLKGGINNITKEKDLYIGPVGTEGIYQIGEGCFTGKKGYEQFIKQLNQNNDENR